MTDIIHVLSALAALVVVLLCLSRGPASPLRFPLGLLGVHQLAWSLTALGESHTRHPAYAVLSAVIAPLFAPLALHFCLVFVGRHRRHARWLVGVYAVFGAETLFNLVSALLGSARVVELSSLLLLCTCWPVAIAVLALLLRHYRRSPSREERRRTLLFLSALLLFLPLLPTDLLADLGLSVPRLSTLGSLFFNSILTYLTLGLLPGVRQRAVAAGQLALFALALAGGYFVLASAFRDNLGVFFTALILLVLAGVVPLWLALSTHLRRTRGLERFAAMGRFSAQLAHDLRNPLAAALGASEFMEEDLKRNGRDHAMAALVVQQLHRLNAVIERYSKLSRMEPQLTIQNINELVKRVLSLQQFAARSGVQVTAEPAPGEPSLDCDSDLVSSALENLVKNAMEAIEGDGRVTVRVELAEKDDVPHVVLSVKDTGRGFDARSLDLAFEPFVTTKAGGSGLGLAFVREVARAHGGDADLSSREGQGTTVSLWLPTKTGGG